MNTQRIRWSTTDNIIACGLGMLLATFAGCADLEREAIEVDKPKMEEPTGPVASATAKEPGLALAMAGKDSKELARVVGSAAEAKANQDKQPKASPSQSSKVDVASQDIAGSPNCEDDTSGLELIKLTFTRDVDGRDPVDDDTSFSADNGRVFAHLRLASLEEGRKVKVVFKRYDREYYKAELDIGKSPRWRTWASVGASKDNVGSWTVDVEDEQGNLLASRKFEIKGDAPSKADGELSEQALPSDEQS